eukprot:gene20864-32571_t
MSPAFHRWAAAELRRRRLPLNRLRATWRPFAPASTPAGAASPPRAAQPPQNRGSQY